MEKEFIPYEQALDLKELGFDEPCLGLVAPNLVSSGYITITAFDYDFDVSEFTTNSNLKKRMIGPQIALPLYQQAFRWFREKYGLTSSITPCSDGDFIYTIYDLNKCNIEVLVEDIEIAESENYHNDYEEAELECLKKLIEIVKKE